MDAFEITYYDSIPNEGVKEELILNNHFCIKTNLPLKEKVFY